LTGARVKIVVVTLLAEPLRAMSAPVVLVGFDNATV